MIGRNGILAICAAFAIALLILFNLPIPQNAGQSSAGLSAPPDIAQNPDFLQKPDAAAQATASEQAQGASGAVNTESQAEGPGEPEPSGANASGSNSSESPASSVFAGGGSSGSYAAGSGAAGTFAVEQEGQQTNDAQSKIDAELQQEIEETAKENPERRIRIIIQISSEDELQKIAELASQKGGKDTAEYKTGKLISLELPADEIAELTSENSVIKIFPEKEVQAFLSESSAQINAQSAYGLNFTGKGIKIAILDTGINAGHEMLLGKVIASTSFVNDENSSDFHGHGTHVSAIAAGSNANGALYSGIAPNAMLLNAKVLNKYGSGTTTGVIAGINWAVENGAKIINLSLGANYSKLDDPINLAIKGAVEKGVVVVAASGNCGACGNCGSFKGVPVPGDSTYAITVGAVDKSNNYACFSSGAGILGIGIKPDVSAPGVNINSAFNDSYASQSGTSMAAPHVSGAIALLLEAKPDLKPADIKAILEQSAVDLGAEGKDTEYGSGLINIAKLLDFNSSLAPQIRAISILPYELTQNNSVDIIANAWDDENIVYLEGIITNPNNEIFVLNFKHATVDRWIASFSQTQALGAYEIKITATDNSTLTTEQSASFTVLASIDYSTEASLIAPQIQQAQEAYVQETAISKDSVSAEFLIDYIFDNLCSDANPNFNIGTSRYSGLEYFGDIDWFKGYSAQKSLLKFYLYPPSRTYDYGFAVYSGCNNTLIGNCDKAVTGNEICYMTVPQGYYYVMVYSKALHYNAYSDYKIGVDYYCSTTQCTSFYWKECYDPGKLCCPGDAPKTGQYYCASDTSWKKCTDASHNACDSHGDYYCTNDGYWAWRPCANGCNYSTGKCKIASCTAGWKCSDEYHRVHVNSECINDSVEKCEFGCDSGTNTCKFASKPCTKAGDCGQDGFISTPSCPYGTNGNLYQDYKTYSCLNSTCSESTELKALQTCNSGQICSKNACVAAPYTEQWICKDTYTRVYQLKDGSYKSGSESACANGCDQNTGNCKNFTCPENNCKTTYWNACIAVDELCCNGDDSDSDPKTAFGQFYCKADEQFAKCTEAQHTACEKQGNYYCAKDSSNLWRFRACEYGCNSTTEQCNAASAVNMQLEYAVTGNTDGVSLFRQPYDYLTIKLKSAAQQAISLSVDSATIYSGICNSGGFSFSGSIECIYIVGNSIGIKSVKATASGKIFAEAKFEVTSNPSMLILTNTEKLLQRFSNDSTGIKLLMETAYATALDGRAVIYDLSKYAAELPVHPFGSFASYNENPSSPSKTPNAYASKVAGFIKSKCRSCKKVMILGDDFVVPHSRLQATDALYYSDSQYALSKTVSITKPFVLFENKSVLLILPDGMSGRLRDEVNALKAKILEKYGSVISEVPASTINQQTCSLPAQYSQSLYNPTVIFIGDRQSNPAINCVLLDRKKQLMGGMTMIRPSPWQSTSTSQTNYALLLIDTNANSEADSNFNALNGFTKMLDAAPELEKMSISDAIWFGLNLIPIVELIPDAIDIATGCSPALLTLSNSLASLALDKNAFADRLLSDFVFRKLTIEEQINDLFCGVAVLATGYDAAGLVADATVIGGIFEVGGDITITSAKLGLKTFLKGIAETSQDALKTLGKKIKDIPSFYKSARIWKESLGSIEKTYGKETSQAVTKLTGRIVEDEADAFMRLSPELIETYGKEAVQSTSKIAEKYALELDGEAAEALAKITKSYGDETADAVAKNITDLCKGISSAGISIASAPICIPKDLLKAITQKADEMFAEAENLGLKWADGGKRAFIRIASKEGLDSAIVKDIDKLKGVKGIDRYAERLGDQIETANKEILDGIKYEAKLNANLLNKGYKIEEMSISAKKYGFADGDFDTKLITPDGRRVTIETKSGNPRNLVEPDYADPDKFVVKKYVKEQIEKYRVFVQTENIDEIWLVFEQPLTQEIRAAFENLGGIIIKLEREII